MRSRDSRAAPVPEYHQREEQKSSRSSLTFIFLCVSLLFYQSLLPTTFFPVKHLSHSVTPIQTLFWFSSCFQSVSTNVFISLVVLHHFYLSVTPCLALYIFTCIHSSPVYVSRSVLCSFTLSFLLF